MSWSKLNGEEVNSIPSTEESRRFGLTVHRLEIPLQVEYHFDDLVQEIGSIEADLIIVRLPCNRVDWMGQLQLHRPDLEMIHADTLMYWTHTLTGSVDPIQWAIQHPPTASKAGEAIESIFGGYRNHYAANPLLKHINTAEAYRRWAVAHIESGGEAIALSDDGQIIAMATLTPPTDHVEVLLAGVIPERQGRGVYGSLLSAVVDWVGGENASTTVISTQAHNIGVQRAWARFGFLPKAAFDTFHVMRRHPSV